MIQFSIQYSPISLAKWQAVDSSGKVWKSHIYKRGIIDWISAQCGTAPTKSSQIAKKIKTFSIHTVKE